MKYSQKCFEGREERWKRWWKRDADGKEKATLMTLARNGFENKQIIFDL